MTPSHLHTIARAVVDGSDVDWASAEASTDAGELEAVRQLRLVASIGQAARELAGRWGPFEIREQIGHGTFGTVFRAWDPKVEREIALKLLNEGSASVSDDGAIHEARLLATVEHPNIVPVYGADVHDGRVGIWMKFIHGKTLKDLLVEGGPFGAEEAAVIGRDLCQALAAVHGRGLVHRDIKTQNVMREVGGRIVLMDFGAGQPLDGAKADTPKGTPAYLAPEIVAGGNATPGSDLYSLAVLLYHLVSGEFPVIAATWEELRTKHARGERRLLRDARPDLPDWYVSAVDRGLALEPERRPESAGAFHQLLERGARKRERLGLAALAIGGCLLAVGGAWAWSRASAPGPAPIASLGITPFENLTGAPQLDFLSNGLARQVGSRLAAVDGLRVVVPSNVIAAGSPRELGGRLGVQSVLTCRLTGTSQRVRLGCDLADSRSNRAIWTDTTEYNVADVVALESELARRIAFALKGPLTDVDNRHLVTSAVSPEAMTLYLRGRHEWSFRREDSLNRSIEYYQAAIRTAPDFALAYSGLADAYSMLGAYGFVARPVAYLRAFEAADRAVALDATSAEPHFSLGYAQKNRFHWSAAEASFRRGLELSPGSSLGHHWFSMYLTQMKRFDEAIAEAKQAASLDPSSLAARANFASLLVMARRYRDGIAEWESCLAAGSNQVNTYRAMSKAFLYLGDHARALEFADEARRRAQAGAADEELKADLAYVFARTGRRAEAIELADELVLRYRSAGELIAGSIAAVYTGLGDPEQAFTWLAAAMREQDPELGYLLVDPKWDPLRSDARFNNLLVEMGFPLK